ncbi:MAG TPA: hypothetical protein VIK00_01740 [Candidatus Limnocylindrales bacterium]
MSFDPQNPRGAPRPPAPPTPSYIPPQPVERRPPAVLLAAITVFALFVVFSAVYLIFNGGGPTSSPLPASNASASASHVVATPANSAPPRTGPPTAGASLPTTPEPSPATPYDAFLRHVPDLIRVSCTQGSSTDPAIAFSTQCTTTGGIVVVYSGYDSADSMNTAYQKDFAGVQIDANSGSCEDHSTWPAESTYDVNGAPAGHRLCADVAGAPTITWTDDRLDILSVATGQAADVPGLIELWTNEAGPIP